MAQVIDSPEAVINFCRINIFFTRPAQDDGLIVFRAKHMNETAEWNA